jgi:hypothetical protein
MKKAEKNLKNEPTGRRSTGPDRSNGRPAGLKCGPGPERPVAGTGSIYGGSGRLSTAMDISVSLVTFANHLALSCSSPSSCILPLLFFFTAHENITITRIHSNQTIRFHLDICIAYFIPSGCAAFEEIKWKPNIK